MKPPSSSTVAIALIWAFVLVTSVLGSREAIAPVPASFPPGATVTILLMPILFFGVMPFWARQSPFFHPTLARFVDARLGEGALASFLVRLKPLLLFAVAGAIQGGVGIIEAARANASSGAYVLSGFFVSGAIGFALAHQLFYMRRAPGVFPAEQLSSEPSSQTVTPGRKPLGEALRAYWKSLIGIALFPAVAFVGGDFLHLPFDYLALPFFAVCLLAAWPYLSGRAPYTFWFVAMLVYLAGGLLAMVLGYTILR